MKVPQIQFFDFGVVPQFINRCEQRQAPKGSPSSWTRLWRAGCCATTGVDARGRWSTETVEEFHKFLSRTWTLDNYFYELLVSGSQSPRCTCVSLRLFLQEFQSFYVEEVPEHWKTWTFSTCSSCSGADVFFGASHFTPFFGLCPLGRESRLFLEPSMTISCWSSRGSRCTISS